MINILKKYYVAIGILVLILAVSGIILIRINKTKNQVTNNNATTENTNKESTTKNPTSEKDNSEVKVPENNPTENNSTGTKPTTDNSKKDSEEVKNILANEPEENFEAFITNNPDVPSVSPLGEIPNRNIKYKTVGDFVDAELPQSEIDAVSAAYGNTLDFSIKYNETTLTYFYQYNLPELFTETKDTLQKMIDLQSNNLQNYVDEIYSKVDQKKVYLKIIYLDIDNNEIYKRIFENR